MSKYCFSCKKIVQDSSAVACPFCGAPFSVAGIAGSGRPQSVTPQIQYNTPNPVETDWANTTAQPQVGGMKCPNCGANIGSGTVCQYCGSQITYSMKREQEQINKQGCPQCGSSNVQFKRENHGELRGKNSKQIIHRTVGLCKDCGYTWYPSFGNESSGKNNMVWWVLGWLFFFPAPVMVLIWRKKNTWDIKIKIAVTIAFWLLIFILGSTGDDNDSTSKQTPKTTQEQSSQIGDKDDQKIQKTTPDQSRNVKAPDSNQTVRKEKPERPDSTEKYDSTEKPAENVTPVESTETTTPDILDGLGMEEKNAVNAAISYLDFSPFSRQGLIDQLSSEYGSGYTLEAATLAVDLLETNNLVDWNEQAVKEAISYLDYSPFSRAGLIDQLTSEYGAQFTQPQAEYAISYLESNGLVDWNEQAVKEAQSYLNYSSFSRSELIDQLSSEYGSKFTYEQAEYAVTAVGY